MIVRAVARYTLFPGDEPVVPGMALVPKPMARRMAAPARRAMACALAALAEAGTGRPDAILYATGMGCLADTQEFLLEVERNPGSLLSPTSFMRSTHNTEPGLIALVLGAKGPNLTFSQGFTGFHAALLAAMMHLERRPADHVLVGAGDEHVPLLDHLFDALGGAERVPSGVRPAEGAAFFVLGGADGAVKGRVVDVRMGPAERVTVRNDIPVWAGALMPSGVNGTSYVHRTGLHHAAPAVAMALALEEGALPVQLLDREDGQLGLVHLER